MACLELDSSHFFSNSHAIDSPFRPHLECRNSSDAIVVPDYCTSSQSQSTNIPNPPPLPRRSYGRKKDSGRVKDYSRVTEEVQNSWDKLFREGYEADVHVLADNGGIILSHSCILGINSPVLRTMLQEAKVRDGFRCIRIFGVPPQAVRVFIRFLYSSRYEQDELKQYVVHLLVLSHVFSVQSLKRACIDQVEKSFLAAENVVDMLQLARRCDAPRLSLICTRMIIRDFKAISLSEGWKVMKQADPILEQELLESLVEADSKNQERADRREEKVYLQLYEAMEALLHICRDGCRTIGPRDQMLKESQAACNFPACKGIELLVRHFSACKVRVPGGCANCKRMWQLLELHSRMCSEPDTCKVPLCRHFKEKMKHLSKREETKWKILVYKVLQSKGTISSISARGALGSQILGCVEFSGLGKVAEEKFQPIIFGSGFSSGIGSDPPQSSTE